MYIAISVFVVFTFGAATRTNFLENNYRGDIAILVGCIIFGVAIVVTTPLYIHTLRNSIKEVRDFNSNTLLLAIANVYLMLK